MCMSTVSVKWQKELFKDVEIDTSQPPYVFKCQLYDLTGVPPERQKIMVKGGLLKVSKCLCKCAENDPYLDLFKSSSSSSSSATNHASPLNKFSSNVYFLCSN